MPTVQALFASLQPVLPELAKLLDAAHNYNLIVELVLELLGNCARHMLVFLTAADAGRLYQFSLDTIRAYAVHAGGRVTREASAEEDAHRDLLLFMELLMNLLSKDLMDLSPYAAESAPITASEVKNFEKICKIMRQVPPGGLINLPITCLRLEGLPARTEPVDAADERRIASLPVAVFSVFQADNVRLRDLPEQNGQSAARDAVEPVRFAPTGSDGVRTGHCGAVFRLYPGAGHPPGQERPAGQCRPPSHATIP